MGNNMAECGKRRASQRLVLGDQSPPDTEDYNKPNLRSEEFWLKVSNIRLKNVPFEVSIILQMEDVFQKSLDVRTVVGGNVRWEDQLNPVFFKSNEYELRKKFLKVMVLDQDKVMSAQLRLNLFFVIRGPIQQDFPLDYIGLKTKSKNSRIRIDVRISQFVKFHLRPSAVEVKMIKQHPGQPFHYSLKYTNYNGKGTESLDSYNAENAFYAKRLNDVDKEEEFQKKKKTHTKVLDGQTHTLKWTTHTSLTQCQAQLPSLNLQILSKSLDSACFHFLLWRVPKSPDDITYDNEQELYSECQIPLNKIYRDNPTIEEKDGVQFEVREVCLVEKLWSQGRETGELTLHCKVIVARFIRQMVVCVRTQFGIQTNNPILQQEGLGHCPQIKELIKLKQSIQQKAVTVRQLKNDPKGIDSKIISERRNLYHDLKKLIELLQSPKNKTSVMYTYSSQQDFFKGQVALLNVANKLFYFLQEDQTAICELCWKGLVAVMNRGEFLLSYIGFPKDQNTNRQGKEQSTLESKKIDLRLEYQNFLYQALGRVLQCLNSETLPESERTFAQYFCACSYFRIPQFRNKLLKYIEKQDDPCLEQVYVHNPKQEDSLLGNLFNWEQNFYSPLSGEEKYKLNICELVDTLAQDNWRIRIQKRGGYFFFFIKYWVMYVEMITATKVTIPWNEIPGYDCILRAFIGEMHKRKISEYPDIMVEAATKLSSNELLLGPFMKILFVKTCMFDSDDVLNTIQIITRLFKDLKQRKKKIPASFNYKIFFYGIEKILSGTHCFVISKCIEMIYAHFDMFSSAFKNDISLFFLGSPFFELFLNWAPIVRNNFFHFLVYKIQLSLEGQATLTDEIYMRYRLLKTVLNNVQKVKCDRENIFLTTSHDQHYYKILKRKLFNRKRRRGPEQDRPQATSKYKISELSKVPIHRSLSDAYNKPLLELTLDKRKKSYTPRQEQDEPQDLVNLPQARRKRKMTLEDTFALPQQIAPHLVEYIETALHEFSTIDDYAKENMGYFIKNPKEIPKLETRIPIDKGETRPDSIDDW